MSALTPNRHILVIDDNTSIHEDFRKILSPQPTGVALDQARAALFGEDPTLPVREPFELDFTDQGQKGLGLVHSAIREGCPYALAFVDMRMPPGWDGLETIDHLWSVAPELEIVICTAYSDHPWEDVSRRIGQTDKVLILMKPFNSVEVIQLASALTAKWNLRRQIQLQMESLASCVTQRTVQLSEANARFQEAIATSTASRGDGSPLEHDGTALRSKEEFLAIMSHEILTPLNSLTTTVAQLLNTPLTDGQRPQVTAIQRASQDIMALITDMHAFMAGKQPVPSKTQS